MSLNNLVNAEHSQPFPFYYFSNAFGRHDLSLFILSFHIVIALIRICLLYNGQIQLFPKYGHQKF